MKLPKDVYFAFVQSKWQEILTVSSEGAGSGAEICYNLEKMIIGDVPKVSANI